MCGLSGCASSGAKADSDERAALKAREAQAAKERAGSARAGEGGLEVSWWVTAADGAALAEALGPFRGSPVPMPEAEVELWRAHGLRVFSVPVDRVSGLRERLGSTGPVQQQWLGQAVQWTETVRGPEAPGGQTVALDAERVRLGPGALRLLARSWIEPAPPGPGETTARAQLRVEVMPQHHESVPGRTPDPLRLDVQPTSAETQGLLFSRLYARMALGPDRAVVIVPERPGVEWTRAAAAPDGDKSELAEKDARGKPRSAEAGNEWSGVRAKSGGATSTTENPWAKPDERGGSAAASKGGGSSGPGVARVGEVVRAGAGAGGGSGSGERSGEAATYGPRAGEGRGAGGERGDANADGSTKNSGNSGDSSRGIAKGPEVAGPVVPRVASLGEALLMRVDQARTPTGEPGNVVRTLRAVVILEPKGLGSFTLTNP